MDDIYKTKPITQNKIVFFDIDGVLTPNADFVPGKSPNITSESIRILHKFVDKGFLLVFITARGVNELRLVNGFESLLKKQGLLEFSLIYGSAGLDYATYSNEFKLKNNQPVFKNGDVVLERKGVIKRETFGNLDQFLLYKMLLGREIQQQLKYKGFHIAPAINEKLLTDARLFYQLKNNTKTERAKAVLAAQKIADEMREAFLKTNKYGSPVDLISKDIVAGIAIEPAMLGKHFGVLRALKLLGIKPTDELIGYAFGDNNSDGQMKMRKDIEFVKINGTNKDFVKKAEKILAKY
jgi:hydroxymethylpyrimidine pyrophosphatase-like HAD family hydrolase